MKKKEKIRKPQKEKKKVKTSSGYVPQKALFGNGDDYYVYKMKPLERLVGGALGFMAGAFVIMVFFRSYILALAAGLVLILPGIRRYQNFLKEKRRKVLLFQFRDMLESLTASYSTGKNTLGAFEDAYGDMIDIYGKKADIVCELKLIVDGIYNGQRIEDLLENFAKRSHLDDVESFATIFEVSNQFGGNLKKVVGDTYRVISEKLEMEMEIKTLLTANQNELNIMMLMPLVIMLTLSSMGSMSVIQNTPLNVLTKIIALVMFGVAYITGRKIIDIRV